MFGNPETTTGGNALKFYSSMRFDTRRKAMVEEGEEVIGIRSRVKVIKNKLATPFKEAEFEFTHGRGWDIPKAIVEKAIGLDIIQKSGSWIKKGEQGLGQGVSKACQYLTSPEGKETYEQVKRELKTKLHIINTGAIDETEVESANATDKG
jgi:recombination protein RecA